MNEIGFDDFIASIGEHAVKSLIEQIDAEFRAVITDVKYKDLRADDPTSMLAVEMYRLGVEKSFLISGRLLREYHEWLQGHFVLTPVL